MSRQKAISFAAVCNMPLITTALRVRPTWEPRRRRGVPVRGQTATCVLDAVLADTSTQHQAYQHLAASLVDNFIQGESAVLLVYGASQTGKTYTLQGPGSSQDAGIIPQAVQAVIRGLTIVPKSKYRLSVSYCGLSVGHDAQLVDLLASPGTAAASGSLRDASAAAVMAGLTSWTLEDPADVLEALKCKRLQASAAGLSKCPKGSLHTMLTLQLDSYAADRSLLHSKHLTFVELAAPDPKDPMGMGRCNESANARSLAMAYNSLGKVLAALRHSAPAAAAAGSAPIGAAAAAALAAGGLSNTQQLQHVPWRDSPLTRWLQERLHSANTITLLGTVSSSIEAAADTLATISWVSRFSAASRSGAGGVLVSFSWMDAVAAEADGTAAGSYLRFHPESEVIRSSSSTLSPRQGPQKQKQQQQQQHGAPALASAPAVSFYEPGCSSPMVNQCSPNLAGPQASRTPMRPHSAASVFNAGRPGRWQQQLQPSPDSTPVTRHVQQWQQKQEQLMQQYQQQHGKAGEIAGQMQAPASPDRSPEAAAADEGNSLADEVLLYGELMSALRRAGGGLRAEAILEQLLQELGAARAGLSAERGEARTLRSTLAALQQEHSGCEAGRRLLQEHVQQLQQQLEAAQKSLAEVSSDRDMFLRRLTELEADEDGLLGRPGSRLEQQRTKAHATQLRMMESELNALAASNQQLRGQLDLTTQQLNRASRDKLAAQESAVEASERLHHELEVMRSAADIEGALRKELEAAVAQLREELSKVAADKSSLQQQYNHAQISIDALAAELQDSAARVQAVEDKLAQAQQERNTALQQSSALQAQVSALEEMTQQLRQAADDDHLRQQQASLLQGVVSDLEQVLHDFDVDLRDALHPQWQHLIEGPATPAAPSHAAAPAAGSADAYNHNSKLRSRLMELVGITGSANKQPARTGQQAGAAVAVDTSLPAALAQKLEAVVGVLRLAADERSRVTDELQGSRRRMQLLEANVDELRKLVSTQEDLQQQLATQLAACQAEAEAAEEAHKSQQAHLQQQLDEAQTAVAALAEELQSTQSSLQEAQRGTADRDQALDALADELVGVAAAHDDLQEVKQQVEQQAMALAAELEEALLQLSIRDQVLDQVWSQLKGLPQYTPAEAGAAEVAGLEDKRGGITAGATQLAATFRSATLDKLDQQPHLQEQQERQRSSSVSLRQRRSSSSSILASFGGSGAVANPTAASLAQQAVQAARRRSSQTEQVDTPHSSQPGNRDRISCPGKGAMSPTATGGSAGQFMGGQHYAPGTPQAVKQQQPQQGLYRRSSRHQQDGQQTPAGDAREQQQVQPLVVAAVQKLRDQVVSLLQQLAEAEAGNRSSGAELQALRQQHEQLLASSDQLKMDKLVLESTCRQLNMQLQEKERALQQAQEHCQQLLSSLKQVQQRLQQQQATSRVSDPAAPVTPSLAQQTTELEECKRQLADTKIALADASAAVSSERAARLKAEDAEAGRQQLLQKIADLQSELKSVHAEMLEHKRAISKLKDELALMATSRDTWREAAKRSEAAAAEAKSAAEAKCTELTRARAELLQARQQASTAARQLDTQHLQALLDKGEELGCSDTVSEGLAARLAAAQVMRREAEDKAAELARKLACAERTLRELQQQHGESEAELGGKLCLQGAALARSRAEATAAAAAAEGDAARAAELAASLAEQGKLLQAVRMERDALQQQLDRLGAAGLVTGRTPVAAQASMGAAGGAAAFSGAPPATAAASAQQQLQQQQQFDAQAGSTSLQNADSEGFVTATAIQWQQQQQQPGRQQHLIADTLYQPHRSSLVDVALIDIPTAAASYESLMASGLGGKCSSKAVGGAGRGAGDSGWQLMQGFADRQHVFQDAEAPCLY